MTMTKVVETSTKGPSCGDGRSHSVKIRMWHVILIGILAYLLSGRLMPLYEDWTSEPINAKMQEICKELSSEVQETKTEIWLPGSKSYIASRVRYFKQTALRPACVAVPTRSNGLQRLLKLIGEHRLPFAVSSGQHHSNIGFSSTAGGLQIDMRQFKDLKLSEDKSYIDVGPGLTWYEVYRILDGTGVQVVGGRTQSVGVGGFLAGGGGMGWSTNSHGMTVNTALEAELVTPQGEIKTVSYRNDPDLFWALRGGGNKFGIVFRWRLQTHEQAKMVYGGMRIYPHSRRKLINQAMVNFLSNNTDPGAQVIISYGVAYKFISIICLQVYYPHQDPGSIFSEFDVERVGKAWSDSWGPTSFADSVGTSYTEMHANQRSLMDEQNFQHFQSVSLLNAAADLSHEYGRKWFINGRFMPLSQSILSIAVEPFQQGWGAQFKETQGVYPYHNSPMPIILLFYWKNARDDDYFTTTARFMIDRLRQIAIDEGQDLSQYPAYPNYAQADRTPEGLFGKENWEKLKRLQKRYDPENVMGLTKYFF